ncbi:hypothetical protein Q6T38_001602 [Campylobacter upsaliensis]|uniref:hypothetical protein n=1 Tax=Campylobacter upsaliensis TaxID=28080 RepID=UPI00126F8075|nr:hypothetical protein [Campylobacter upsaliensis]EAH9136573.1 hypothetical protein [Campylobacter upsaliensis]EAH9148153.1 hypothetical protein [Campylobacter upsaliensis]EAI0017316.1 hypothetical protein [Campylobacter upsaliensis]EAI3339135.1 hypothetical protein [Campylobacter upsaliensis]EAI6211543.1 hypothetical protein [Campylobacter upsaliensis]
MRLISYNSPSSLNFRVFYINWFDDFFKFSKSLKENPIGFERRLYFIQEADFEKVRFLLGI